MSVGVNVNFGALKNQSEFWKSPGNLFLKKGTNPDCSVDDSRIRSKTAPFAFENGLVWTGPKQNI